MRKVTLGGMMGSSIFARQKGVAEFAVGQTVTLGNYGGEAIEWLVLAAEGDKRTLIAVKGQDVVCFNKESSDGNQWERSYIRTWLNDTYYDTAFNAEEKAMITAGPTGDKVWLLSVEEAKRYFAGDDARVCYPTAYAEENGAWMNDNGAGGWWLRSPGSNFDAATVVHSNGKVYSNVIAVNGDDAMVRPVLVVAFGRLEEIAGSEACTTRQYGRLRLASEFAVGQTVTLGNYGGEAVEWLVLAAEGDKRTLIAVKGQDAVCFNKESSDGNQWERSYIRTWLNDTYYDAAFSAEEKAMIMAGPTGDKVWLLSIEEAERYLTYDDARVCYPTVNAKKHGAWTNDSGAGWSWLRSPGSDSDCAAIVDGYGYVYSDGDNVDFDNGLARPVVVVVFGCLEENAGSEACATRQNGRARNASKFAVGKTVTLGNYGGEPVEWLVLAADGDKRTLIAVKGQDAVCFNKNRSDGNRWERSYIRTWLNDTFYNTAFSVEEKAVITAGPTRDKVWLLSVEEAKRYFANDDARVCYPTAYAKKHGAYANSSGAGWWWLRSRGSHSYFAALADSDGRVDACGSNVHYGVAMARPVVVVSLASGGLFD